MKKIFCIASLFILPCAACLSQNDNSTEIAIKQIRAEYNKINSAIGLKSEQKNLEGVSTEGGIIKKYYDNKILRKAVLIFYGETGKSTTEYYFHDSALIFVYEKKDKYNHPMNLKKSTTENIDANRYYFKGKLIKWIAKDGKIVDPTAYQSKEKEINEDLKTYVLQ